MSKKIPSNFRKATLFPLRGHADEEITNLSIKDDKSHQSPATDLTFGEG